MSRPLSEIASTESRRNSGNFNNQSPKVTNPACIPAKRAMAWC
jgi:hypothetical protein